MPGCVNRGKQYFNVWFVCEECFQQLVEFKIAKDSMKEPERKTEDSV
jgi:hypothetical protein